MMDFVVFGLLGDFDLFCKIYFGSIEKASERGVKEEVVRIGNVCCEEVGCLIGFFIYLRKVDEINVLLLLLKIEYVVFV